MHEPGSLPQTTPILERDGDLVRLEANGVTIDAVSFDAVSSDAVSWCPFDGAPLAVPVVAGRLEPIRVRLGDGSLRTVGERRVALEGAYNFRDLGGYRVPEGSVRWGRLYRADHLGALTPGDAATLAIGLGLRTVIDFRGDNERAEYGVAELGVPVTRVAIAAELAEQSSPIERILRGELTSFTGDDVAEMYRSILTDFATSFGRAFELAAAPGDSPAVFHCTAGKDRTGLMAALVLETLGVDRSDVLADFDLTNRYRSARRLAELRPRLDAAGVDVTTLMPFFSAWTPACAQALAWLDSDHGGARGYLEGVAGVAPSTIEALVQQLVEKP